MVAGGPLQKMNSRWSLQTTAVSRCPSPPAEGWVTWVTVFSVFNQKNACSVSTAGSEWERSLLTCPQESLPLVVAGISMEARPPSDF